MGFKEKKEQKIIIIKKIKKKERQKGQSSEILQHEVRTFYHRQNTKERREEGRIQIDTVQVEVVGLLISVQG